MNVYVVTHINKGVLYNVLVFENESDAKEYYNDLKNTESNDGCIDLNRKYVI